MTIAPLFIAFFTGVSVGVPSGDFAPTQERLPWSRLKLKAANAVLDYPVRWELDVGETIETSTWGVTPPGGMTVVADSSYIDGALTACLVSGGIYRRVYSLANTITTSAGRTLEQTVAIRIGPVEAYSPF